MTDPANALRDVQTRIARTAQIAQRRTQDVTLIAVSKTHPASAIAPLIAAGQRVFGENRVQEAQEKWPELRQSHGAIELHLIGQLQSNKAGDAVALFDCIHSLDRPSLVSALAKAMDQAGRQVPCFVQVNIGAEEQKGGCAIADLPALLDLARGGDLPVIGLMCVPPAGIEDQDAFTDPKNPVACTRKDQCDDKLCDEAKRFVPTTYKGILAREVVISIFCDD